MKTLMICLIYATLQVSTFVKGNDFSGYVFNAEHFVLLSIENQDKRYTPTDIDIIQTEKIINAKIKGLNEELVNQSKDCPKIHKNLKKYIRQYGGYINNNGEKIIWINFIWEDEIIDKKLKEEIIQVSDGCSHYWNVKVNLDVKNIYDLKINGNG